MVLDSIGNKKQAQCSKFHIDEKTYENFIEQIKVAELYARENKPGIWAEETDE